MKRNKKFYDQKRLRHELVTYLDDVKELGRFHPDISHPNKHEMKEMIKSKIGCSSFDTKGAKKWKIYKQKLNHKRNRKDNNLID